MSCSKLEPPSQGYAVRPVMTIWRSALERLRERSSIHGGAWVWAVGTVGLGTAGYPVSGGSGSGHADAADA